MLGVLLCFLFVSELQNGIFLSIIRNLVVEYPKHFNGQAFPDNIEKFENAIWLTIITMTTVGFGDLFPRTILGRGIDVLLVIWGTFIVSLMVVVLTNTLNMDQA